MFCKNTKLIVLGPRPIVLNQKAEKHPKPKTLNQTSYTKVQSPMNTLSQILYINSRIRLWQSSGPPQTDDRARPGKNGKEGSFFQLTPDGQHVVHVASSDWLQCPSVRPWRSSGFRPTGPGAGFQDLGSQLWGHGFQDLGSQLWGLGNFRTWFSEHGFQDLGSQLWGLDFHTRGFQDRNLKTFRTWFSECGISILGPGFHTWGFTVAFGHGHPLVFLICFLLP